MTTQKPIAGHQQVGILLATLTIAIESERNPTMVSISLRKRKASKAPAHRRRSSIDGSQSSVVAARRRSSGLIAADHVTKSLSIGDNSPVDTLRVSAVKMDASKNGDERVRQTKGDKDRREHQLSTFKFGIPSTPAPFGWFVGSPNGGLALIPKLKQARGRQTNESHRGMF